MNYILKDENAVYYECGFSCDNVVYLCLGSEAFFITDSRYTHEANEYVKGATVIEGDRRDLFQTVRVFIQKSKVKKIDYNPSEWSVESYEKIASELSSVEFVKEPNFSQKKRIQKSNEEIEILTRAAQLGKEAFDNFAIYLKEQGLGLSEERLHFEAENIFKKQGKLGLSFSPIVAFGANAAKPHALPTNELLNKNELVS